MLMRWIALLALVCTLGACAGAPGPMRADAQSWNGGIWNSTLGYHGPANEMIVGGP